MIERDLNYIGKPFFLYNGKTAFRFYDDDSYISNCAILKDYTICHDDDNCMIIKKKKGEIVYGALKYTNKEYLERLQRAFNLNDEDCKYKKIDITVTITKEDGSEEEIEAYTYVSEPSNKKCEWTTNAYDVFVKEALRGEYPREYIYKVLEYGNKTIQDFKDLHGILDYLSIKIFDDIIGHQHQKEELLNIVNWFNNAEKLYKEGVSIPRGVLLFGEPGNGKTMFIKEMVKHIDATVFEFEFVKGENPAVTINELYNKAASCGTKAVVILDELDLLADENPQIIKVLQDKLDGFASNPYVLTLAATNNFRSFPPSLTRRGRLDTQVKISRSSREDCLVMFRRECERLGTCLMDPIDDETLMDLLGGYSYVFIKSVVNDIVLRHDSRPFLIEQLYASIENMTQIIKENNNEDCHFEVAIHEAAHCVVASLYPQFFRPRTLKLDTDRSYYQSTYDDDNYLPFDKLIAQIKVSMAGLAAEKLFCDYASEGSMSDMDKAREIAAHIVNRCGYDKMWITLPPFDKFHRSESNEKKRICEKRYESLLRKCERDTFRLVKKNKKKIYDVANKLFENKILFVNDIQEILNK